MIRDALPADVAAIVAIYDHHVRNGVATYDTEAPSIYAMQAKLEAVRAAGWPWLVVEHDGGVAGYAYATQIRDRAGYRYTAEDSIYVAASHTRQGLGGRLLTTLVARCEAAGFRQLIAVIGGAEPGSIALHAAAGFSEVGRLHAVGFKFGRWLDNVYMQRALGEGDAAL
nr:GNAT family N-acetyltransferase [Polymorphobacter sp.]